MWAGKELASILANDPCVHARVPHVKTNLVPHPDSVRNLSKYSIISSEDNDKIYVRTRKACVNCTGFDN